MHSNKPKTSLRTLLWLPLFFLIPVFGKSCGFFLPSDHYQLFFLETNLLEDPAWLEFQYPYYYNYREDPDFLWGDAVNWRSDENKANIREWFNYFEEAYSAETLQEVIYEVDPEVFEKLESGGSLPDSVSGNGLMRDFSEGGFPEVLSYLRFAKMCEKWAMPGYYGQSVARSPQTMNPAIEEGLSRWETVQSTFLKNRYAFQIVRLAHYSGQYPKAVQYFDELFPRETGRDFITWRALALKAGALKWMNRKAESMYWFSIVFNDCPPLRNSADHDFNFIDDKYFSPALKFAKNDHEKVGLWMLYGLHTHKPELEPLQKLHEFHAPQPMQEALLIRTLNLIEAFNLTDSRMEYAEVDSNAFNSHEFIIPGRGGASDLAPLPETKRGFWASIGDFFAGIWEWIVGLFSVSVEMPAPALTGVAHYAPDSPSGDQPGVKDFEAFTAKVAGENGTAHPSLWYLAAGLAAQTNRDFDKAEKHYKIAENKAPLGSRLQKQTALLRTLNQIEDREAITPEIEANLAVGMEWLDEMQEEHGNSRIHEKVLLFCGRQYLVQGESVKAAFCFGKSGYEPGFRVVMDAWLTIADLQVLADMLKDKPEGEWENYLTTGFPLIREEVQDIIGTQYLRKGHFLQAQEVFAELPKPYWSSRKLDPDWKQYWWEPGEVPDSPPDWAYFDTYKTFRATFEEETGSEGPEAKDYNKLQFVNQLVALENEAKNNPDKAMENYLRMGNALSSTPFWAYDGVLWQGNFASDFQFWHSAIAFPFNQNEVATELLIREEQFLLEYGSLHLAQHYYLEAAEATSDENEAIPAFFLALECENHNLTSVVPIIDRSAEIDALYMEFIEKYGDSRLYEVYESTCPTLEAYRKKGA